MYAKITNNFATCYHFKILFYLINQVMPLLYRLRYYRDKISLKFQSIYILTSRIVIAYIYVLIKKGQSLMGFASTEVSSTLIHIYNFLKYYLKSWVIYLNTCLILNISMIEYMIYLCHCYTKHNYVTFSVHEQVTHRNCELYLLHFYTILLKFNFSQVK
uniref:Uncharacterized protein n=1 Tax=Heterorhabditis bacteriophora TaxID=37862 RepID=A0A1I7W8B7_HETBA